VEVRHNTALLEKALEHVVRQASIPSIEAEALAHEKMARAQGFRRLATGAALGVAAVGIGLGIWLAYPAYRGAGDTIAKADTTNTTEGQPADPNKQGAEPGTEPAETVPPKSDISEVQQTTPEAPVVPDVVTTNYTIFNTHTVSVAGRSWEVTAGHFFENEADKQWKHAWCYTEHRSDGLVVKVDLANRETSVAQPIAPIASAQTLQKAGLSSLEALTIAAKCPWQDEKVYTVREFTSTPGKSNPFEPEETTYKLVSNKLLVDGSIGTDFLDKLKSYKFDTLEITSPGGLVDVAIDAGSWLRQTGKAVYVSSNCLSACVFVLAGGVSRLADPAAHIGVHRFYNVGPDTASDTEVAQELSSKLLRYLQAMGIDAELFHAMASTPSRDMFYIDRSKLIAWRLLTPLEVGSPEVGNAGDSTESRNRFLMSSSSVWIHKGSILGLTRNGTRRTFRFLQTSGSLSSTSASRGSVLFDGTTLNGKDYTGTAYAFGKCGTKPFEVTGSIAQDGKTITLTGRTSSYDEGCSVTDTGNVDIRLELIGLSSSSRLFADIKARGIALPSGLRDPEPDPIGEIDGYSLTQGADFPGGDFETLKNVSLNQCAGNCSNEARCEGFTYNKKVQWCFLKSSVGSPVVMQDAIAGKRKR
jgi:hypothetical protein